MSTTRISGALSFDLGTKEEECDLLFFNTGDLLNNQSSYVLKNIKKGKSTAFTFSFVCKPKLPYYLHIYVFITDKEERVQLHKGSSRVEWKEIVNKKGAEIDIKDNSNIKIGTISLLDIQFPEIWSYLLTPETVNPSIQAVKEATKISDKINRTVYQSGTYKFDPELQVFYSFFTPALDDSTPIITWPILATQKRSTEHISQYYFLKNLCHISFVLLGYQLTDLSKLSVVDEAELFGETVTLILHTGTYIGDTVGKAKTPTDQWSRPSTWPKLDIAGTDCEDTSNLIQELIHSFQIVPNYNHDPIYEVVQQTSQRYCNLLVLGTLKNTDTQQYEGHAYVTCIDQNYIDEVVRGKMERSAPFFPTLVIETTNYSQTVWNEEYWKNRKKWEFKYNKELEYKNRLPSLFRCKTPAFRIHEKGFYSKVTQLHSTDGLSVICLNGSTLGVEAFDLFMLKLKSDSFQIINNVTNIPKFIREVCIDFPPSYLPSLLQEQKQEQKQQQSTIQEDISTKLHLTLRTIDFKANEKQIKKIFSSIPSTLFIDVVLFNPPNGSFTLICF